MFVELLPSLERQKQLARSLILSAALISGSGFETKAQYPFTDCGENGSCTDSFNSGFFSSGAASLSYDNVISAFHSSAAYAEDGTIKVWGEASKPVNVGSNTNHVNWFGVPTTINATNGFVIDGQPLKIALASLYAKIGASLGGAQYVLLTTTGKLYTWGFQGILVPSALTPTAGEALQEIRNGSGVALGLPTGVNAGDVKMFFGTAGTLAITTCAGDVYVLSQNDQIRQAGSATQWVRIKKDANTNLTGVVAVRGTSAGLVALDNQGKLWTWGYGTRLGDGTSNATRAYATQMTPPGGTGSIKMIAATKRFRNGDLGGTGSNTSTNAFEFSSNTISYFVLYENGSLYAMGENGAGQLGDFTTTNKNNWIQPRFASGGGDGNKMNNVKWISTQEHDGVIGFVSVITNSKELYNWGVESGSDMGRGSVNTTSYSKRDPGKPTEWEDSSNSGILFVENGGHTTMVLQECQNTFGYVGHYRYGSMGDGRSGDNNSGDEKFRFTTSPLSACGIETSPSDLTVKSATQNNEYCKSLSTIQLSGSPSGGVYKILKVDEADNLRGLKFTDAATNSTVGNLDLSNFSIPTNGSRTVRLGYVVPEGQTCEGKAIQLLITIRDCVVYTISISGKIWIDTDEDAIDDAAESILTSSARYANLVDANGDVIQSVLVDPVTGKYNIAAGNTTFTSKGDYKIILTPDQRTPGTFLNTGASAPTGYAYTGTSRSNGVVPASSGKTTEKSGVLSLGNLSTYATAKTNVKLEDANFGVRGSISIGGNVWHDVDGNAVKDGGEKPVSGDGSGDDNEGESSLADGDIYASLVDENDIVVASVKVNPDGTYNFANVPHGDYKVVLTTASQTPGNPTGAPGVPTGWMATGTNYENAPNVSNRSNSIYLGIVTTNREGIDFGIQQAPVAEPHAYSITQPTSNQVLTLNGTGTGTGNDPGPLRGSDPEDHPDAGSLEGKTVRITSPISNGELRYGNTLIEVGKDGINPPSPENPFVIADYDSSLLTITLTGSGYTSVQFDYLYEDLAGQPSEPVLYKITWGSPLPVKWQHVSVSEENGIAVVFWSTTEEMNVSGFDVQHSVDGREWLNVTRVSATNEAHSASYRVTHPLTGLGLHYFRIRSIDWDGSTSISPIVSLRSAKVPAGRLYPNPVVSGELTLDIPSEGIREVRVYTLTGTQTVATKLEGNVLDVRGLSSGQYILSVTYEGGAVIRRNFIVK
jgi:hypothetical protein